MFEVNRGSINRWSISRVSINRGSISRGSISMGSVYQCEMHYLVCYTVSLLCSPAVWDSDDCCGILLGLRQQTPHLDTGEP